MSNIDDPYGARARAAFLASKLREKIRNIEDCVTVDVSSNRKSLTPAEIVTLAQAANGKFVPSDPQDENKGTLRFAFSPNGLDAFTQGIREIDPKAISVTVIEGRAIG